MCYLLTVDKRLWIEFIKARGAIFSGETKCLLKLHDFQSDLTVIPSWGSGSLFAVFNVSFWIWP